MNGRVYNGPTVTHIYVVLTMFDIQKVIVGGGQQGEKDEIIIIITVLRVTGPPLPARATTIVGGSNDVTCPSDWVLSKSDSAQTRTRVPRSTFTPVIVFAGCYPSFPYTSIIIPHNVVRTRYAATLFIVFSFNINIVY